MKDVNAFTVRLNDDVFIQVEDFCKQVGCSRNAAVQMLLNFGILYAEKNDIIRTSDKEKG